METATLQSLGVFDPAFRCWRLKTNETMVPNPEECAWIWVGTSGHEAQHLKSPGVFS